MAAILVVGDDSRDPTVEARDAERDGGGSYGTYADAAESRTCCSCCSCCLVA